MRERAEARGRSRMKQAAAPVRRGSGTDRQGNGRPPVSWRRASPDPDPQHHPGVLVFEIVAMEHVRLIAGERMAEFNCDSHRFSRPHQHGVLQAEVLASRPWASRPARQLSGLSRAPARGTGSREGASGAACWCGCSAQPGLRRGTRDDDRGRRRVVDPVVDPPEPLGEPETQRTIVVAALGRCATGFGQARRRCGR